MPKKNKQILSANININDEFEQLSKLFEKIPANKKRLCAGLIENAAYMKIKLAELQDEIEENGITDEWHGGGGQHGLRKSPAADLYNTMIKNYLAVIKKLAEYLPEDMSKDEFDEWEEKTKEGA